MYIAGPDCRDHLSRTLGYRPGISMMKAKLLGVPECSDPLSYLVGLLRDETRWKYFSFHVYVGFDRMLSRQNRAAPIFRLMDLLDLLNSLTVRFLTYPIYTPSTRAICIINQNYG